MKFWCVIGLSLLAACQTPKNACNGVYYTSKEYNLINPRLPMYLERESIIVINDTAIVFITTDLDGHPLGEQPIQIEDVSISPGSCTYSYRNDRIKFNKTRNVLTIYKVSDGNPSAPYIRFQNLEKID